MIKRPPSRNQRSKGIKLKHVIQIVLLLGVCLWLIYQVKHNHDKKKEFDENDAKVSVRAQTDEVLKLGRKDLHPVKDEVNRNGKHEEEEDEENKYEPNEQENEGNMHDAEESEENKLGVKEQEKEENKHGAEEQEEDENTSEGMEDEGRGDDVIDENDHEKSGVDVDRDEEVMDEEKEKEDGDEKENENNEGEEKGFSVENHNTHEAREEQYKGDDASSAVAHDTHTTSTDTFSLENSAINSEVNITKPENKTNYSDVSNRSKNNPNLKVAEGEDTTSPNATAGKETGNNSLFNPLDSSYLNKTTATTNYIIHLETSSNNMTVMTTEASNNLTGTGTGTSSSSVQNTTMISSEPDRDQNTMVNTTVTDNVKNVRTDGLEQSGSGVSEKNLPGTNSTVSVKTVHGDAAVGESSNRGADELEKTYKFVATNETENNSGNSDGNESSDASDSDKPEGNTETGQTNENQNTDTTEDEMFKIDSQTDETDETLDSSSTNGTSESVEHDDSSDSHIHEDVTEAQTDLDTLPDVRNEDEVDNDEETAAE
ncbi:hypothetical protein Lalb_Chr06g0164961 [Lupinus albus]|uniref:Uncharacterized protein n=1 Tax=Lupinus albus TaxID=3870 RepID=A0A6A4QDI5_LUPAL|nr:hypothetical protein Lalb_Chr06g0164961 [Lupinus albus]